MEVYEHLGGEPGAESSRIEAQLDDPVTATDQERDEAKSKAREEYLATMLLMKSDPKRYGSLVAEITNAYTRGADQFPETINGAYDMLVNYVNPAPPASITNDDMGIAFLTNSAQGSSNQANSSTQETPTQNSSRQDNTRGGRGRNNSRSGRGGRGSRTSQPTTGSSGDNAHVQDADGTELGNLENADTPYLHVLPSIATAESLLQNEHSSISLQWLLLDSCSSVNLIANKKLLHGLYTVETPLRIHCNAGTVSTNVKGYLGAYPEPVWFNPEGIANILSMNNVAKYFRIKMDTKTGDEIIVSSHKQSMRFRPTNKGLYVTGLDPTTDNAWTLITTVKDQMAQYTRRQRNGALAARRLQNIVMHPSSRALVDIVDKHLRGCDITRGDVLVADDIYGANLGSLKGKTVHRPNPHVVSGVDPVPSEVLERHQSLDLAIDIMFVNKIPFFITMTRGLRFGTVEALPNRQIPTIVASLQTVIKMYRHRGFSIRTILSDPEFEVLRPSFPTLNCCAAGEHVPDIERYIRTVKDRARSAYRMLPFLHVPCIMVIHLIKNAVFWLNAFPHHDGVSKVHSPRYIMTGRQLYHKLHARIEFGAYVQTHEEHSNEMTHRTIGAICLGPTGNQQGGHWFMSLTSGSRISRHRWSELPMPREVIDRVNAIGRTQQMPSTITYADRHGRDIANIFDVEIENEDDDDSTYSDDTHSSSESSDSDHNDDDPGFEEELFYRNPDEHSDHEHDPDVESIVNNDSDNISEASSIPPAPPDNDAQVDIEEQRQVNEPDENTGVDEQSVENTGVGEQSIGIEEQEDIEETTDTVHEQFQRAVDDGVRRATDPSDQRQLRNNPKRSKRDENFEYMMLTGDGNRLFSFLTEQMSAKRGIKVFGEVGEEAIMKELKQLVYRNVIRPRRGDRLTAAQRRTALKYLMFLKQKRDDSIKGRGCADGRTQRLYKSKDETSSPTIATESLFLLCVINAVERRHVITCDVPGAFMQTDMDELLHLKLEGEIAELLLRIEPSYKQYVIRERGKTVIYAQLNKALYGALQSALLWWKEVRRFLIDEQHFTENPYDPCVVNKMVKGKQCTVGWHIDDFMISHVDPQVVEAVVAAMNHRFGKEKPLTVTRGKVHDYLGMNIDFSVDGSVSFDMPKYVNNLIDECPPDLRNGPCNSPAANHLFQVNDKAGKLNEEQTEQFHHLVAKLLYLAKRTRPDLQTAIAFLTTRVQSPDEDDYRKLGRCLRYLAATKEMKLTISADSLTTIRWWVDAAYGVHGDLRSHTGATMMLGKGSVYSVSTKQKINTRSSTEAELVGVNDVMAIVLWTRLFLEAQGYYVHDNVIFQDNESAMLLEQNGKASSGRKTRHINIRYYFVTDNIRRQRLRVEHCPTEHMIGDFHTKPLQGAQFRRFRKAILNLPDDGLNHDPIATGQECVEDPTTNPESSPEHGARTYAQVVKGVIRPMALSPAGASCSRPYPLLNHTAVIANRGSLLGRNVT